LISNAIILIDQFTKFLVVTRIPRFYSIPVIKNFFHLTHIRNSGVAFGLFSSQPSGSKSLLFVFVSMVAVVAILNFFHHTPDDKKAAQYGLILIFSGAIGNMIDRVLHNEVIDFLDFFYNDFHWPAFNVADSCITVGVAMMIIDLFRGHSPPPPSEIAP
jgi:signal peptidase II